MVIQIQAQNNFSMNPGLAPKELGVKPKWTKSQLMEAFKKYDRNGDGKLSKEELKQAFRYLGAFSGGYKAGRALAHVDADHNGFVEIGDKEMEDLVNYAFQCGFKLR